MSFYVSPQANIPNATMRKFECDKYLNDSYSCIGCENPCEKGIAAVARLEQETRTPMTKRQIYLASEKMKAMNNYLEAMKQPDPLRYIMEKYSCKNENIAKHKLYLWQRTYGTNLVRVNETVTQIQDEIESSKSQINQTDAVKKKTKSVQKEDTNPEPEEEKKVSKRQEEKISQGHLEKMRLDMEKEFLEKEAEIEEHKRGITECEKRMEEITNQIQAIRQILEIFKEKDKLYV